MGDSIEVLVTGTFNVLHAGHIRLLEFANRFGKVTVGINSDDFLYRKYGKENTVKSIDRVYVLKSNIYVENVFVFSEENPGALIEKLKPKFYVKGPDYKNIKIPEDNIINLLGVKKIIQPIEKEYNASDLIKTFDINDLKY